MRSPSITPTEWSGCADFCVYTAGTEVNGFRSWEDSTRFLQRQTTSETHLDFYENLPVLRAHWTKRWLSCKAKLPLMRPAWLHSWMYHFYLVCQSYLLFPNLRIIKSNLAHFKNRVSGYSSKPSIKGAFSLRRKVIVVLQIDNFSSCIREQGLKSSSTPQGIS